MQGETTQQSTGPTAAESRTSERGAEQREALESTGAAVAREAEHMTEEARELLHAAAEKMRKPSVGAIAIGAAVLAAAAVFGASEAAVAAVAGYAVFRMLRGRRRGGAAREEERAETSEEAAARSSRSAPAERRPA